MGNDIRYTCLLETRRLLLVMGVVFALFLFIQYFELPYGKVLSSLLSPRDSQASSAGIFVTRDSYGYHNGSINSTYSSNLNNANVNDSGVKDDYIDPEDERISSKNFLEMNNGSTVQLNYTSGSNSSLDNNFLGEIVPTPTPEENVENNKVTPLNKSSISEDSENILPNKERPGKLKADLSTTLSNFSASSTTAKRVVKKLPDTVVPINEMNDMLLQSHSSYRAMKPRWSSAVDQDLLNAKSLIENAPIIWKDETFDVNLYRNFSTFKRSYELMAQTLKVYIYSEGERPIFHQPPLKGIYASEGWFMKLLKANKHFITKKPKRAHLFYLPFSSRVLETTLYVPNSHNRKNMLQCLSDYVDLIMTKYSFWNRTGGADHFLVACHDWAPAETRERMSNCIRALCNADVREGFKFGKDVSLPETFVRNAQNPLRELGGKPPSQRRTLAFFAGNMHGYLRPILLNHWENKDPDMKIFGRIRKTKGQMSYVQYMKSSKYCICAKGYEVNSPRVVEAIFYECVPVIISDNFVPPFFETLNWESFAVFVMEKDIPNLKNILLSISKRRYVKMQRRVKQVQQHFLWHTRPVKYDIFHMILHSVWFNRVFQTQER